MRHQYYRIETDGFWVKVCNPAWSNNYKLSRAWSWRFRYFTADPRQRLEMLEFLQLQMGWDEMMTSGTFLQLYDIHAELAKNLPDAGCCTGGGVSYDVPVVSPRVKQLTDRLSLQGEIEFERYPIYTHDGEFIQYYFCLRYLVHLECADEQRSYFHCNPPSQVFGRLVLRRQEIGVHRMFVVSNYSPDTAVVRSDIKEVIEQAGLTGFSFEELEVI